MEFAEYCVKYLNTMGMYLFCISVVHPYTNHLIERYNGEICTSARRIITAYLEAHWAEVIGSILVVMNILPTGLEFLPYSLVFKQVPTWNAAYSPTSEVGATRDLPGEDSLYENYWVEVFK